MREYALCRELGLNCALNMVFFLPVSNGLLSFLVFCFLSPLSFYFFFFPFFDLASQVLRCHLLVHCILLRPCSCFVLRSMNITSYSTLPQHEKKNNINVKRVTYKATIHSSSKMVAL